MSQAINNKHQYIMKHKIEFTKEEGIIIKQAEAFFNADVERNPKTVADFLGHYFINLGHDPDAFSDKLKEALIIIQEFCHDSES
jgi:hypothetical protein